MVLVARWHDACALWPVRKRPFPRQLPSTLDLQLFSSPKYSPAVVEILQKPVIDQNYGLDVKLVLSCHQLPEACHFKATHGSLCHTSLKSRNACRLADVLDVVPELSEKLGTESGMVLMLMDEAVAEAQKTLMTTSVGGEDEPVESSLGVPGRETPESAGFGLYRREWCFKPRVHIRLSHLPGVPEYNKPNVSSIRATDIGRFVQVPGTVIRTGASRVLEAERQYQCTAQRCGFVFTMRSTVEANHTAELPTVCQAPGGSCKGKSFKVVEGSVVRTDYQEIKIQEQVSKEDRPTMSRQFEPAAPVEAQ